jgi:2',3'-cyclic-nucleotide 3'-phosphodiesterase
MCAATNKDANSAGDPGLSLWLVPTEGSDIYNGLTEAITRVVPSTLGVSDSVPKFVPHLTLASRIPKQSTTEDPQKWLDGIDVPAISTVEVKFRELATGDAFFKKLFIRCERTDSLLQLAASCRAFSSAKLDEAQYDPHVSIL